MWVVSFICLFVVAVLCAIGVFSRHFDDNLGQRVGMAVVFLGAAGRLESLAATNMVLPETTFMHVGMATFAAGLAWRTYKGKVCA